jgi:hypothetical protein
MIPSLTQKASKSWYVRLLGLPATQMALAALLLASEFVTGPFIQFPITFIIPVGLAAQFSNPRLSYGLAVTQPLVCFGFVFFWDAPWSVAVSIVNAVIRMAVLLIIAYFINRTKRLAQEVKRLEGFLPICSFCKKIRNEQNEWQQMETYISKHSQADFTHGICPECAKTHYSGFLGKSPNA